MKHLPLALVAFALLTPIAACGGRVAGPTSPSAPPTVPAAPAATASNLTINGFTSLSKKGDTGRLTAFVTFSDGSVVDMSTATQWSLDDQSVATIDSSGLVTAVTDGHTLVTAKFSDVMGTREIMVDLAVDPTP